LNRYEKHGLAGNRKIKPFLLLENGSENSVRAVRGSRARQTKHKIGLGKLKTIASDKPNKPDVYEIDSFNKFNFSQWQRILDTLIDVL